MAVRVREAGPALPAGSPPTADAEFRADLMAMSRIVRAGLWLNVGGAMALYLAGFVPRMRPWPVLGFATAVQLTASLAAALAMTIRRPLALYLAFHLLDVVWVSGMVFFSGGWFCPGPGLFYALIVVNGGGAGGIPAHLLATVSAAAYAGTLALERLAGPVAAPLADQIASATMMAISLNLLAAYTGRLAGLLRARRAALATANNELETRVVQRTSELEAQRTALQGQTDRLRSVLYVLTHDLKNPVNAIHLRADLLLHAGTASLSPAAREGLQRIAQQAAAAEQKIGNLMDLFRITSQQEPERWVRLATIVEQAVETLQPQIGEKHVRLDVQPLPLVRGQPGKLLHIMTNLLGNAVKYVPAGAGVVHVRGGEAGGTFWLTVEDNGIGIAPEYQESIFELFHRVPDSEQVVDGRVVPGTGVGLALVKQLVEQHGGSVSVRSEPGRGSCFDVRFRTPEATADART